MLVYYLQMMDTLEEKIRFEQIYLNYRGLMYRVAEGVLHNCQDAEDAVYNAFLRIIKQFNKLQSAPVEDLAPQIVVIARNEAISLLRKRRGEVPLEDWDSVAESSEAVTDYHMLVDNFTRLSQTYRAVLEMKLLMGYSDGEIAAKLGLTKTAASTRVNRGHRLLRDIVEREGFLLDA